MVSKTLHNNIFNNTLLFFVIIFFLFSFSSSVLAGNYNEGPYNSGVYNIGEVPVTTSTTHSSSIPLAVLQAMSDAARGQSVNTIIPGCAVGNLFSTVTGQACPNPVVVTTSGISDIQKVIKNYKFGIKNNDVKILQLFLIKENKGSGAKALSLNGATNYFGKLTKSALAEWQKVNGLSPDGIFGPKTRAKIKALGL